MITTIVTFWLEGQVFRREQKSNYNRYINEEQARCVRIQEKTVHSEQSTKLLDCVEVMKVVYLGSVLEAIGNVGGYVIKRTVNYSKK